MKIIIEIEPAVIIELSNLLRVPKEHWPLALHPSDNLPDSSARILRARLCLNLPNTETFATIQD